MFQENTEVFDEAKDNETVLWGKQKLIVEVINTIYDDIIIKKKMVYEIKFGLTGGDFRQEHWRGEERWCIIINYTTCTQRTMILLFLGGELLSTVKTFTEVFHCTFKIS